MKITITARKTSVKDAFRERAEKKLAKFDRFFDDDVTAYLTVTNEKDRETVEVTVQSQGITYRAEKTTADRADSLDAVVDTLFRQIVKNKSKLSKKLRANAFDASLYEDPADLTEETYQVVRNKRFPVKPMSTDEAILEMNLVGHEFYMFRNVASGEINVVYRRKDGNYGLIEPQ